MKSILLLIVCLLTISNSYGQEDGLNPGQRLNMIRAGVLFMAEVKDRGELSNIKSAKNTKDLIRYSDKYNIEGLSGRIRKWTKLDLETLSNIIKSDLTSADRAKRCADNLKECNQLKKTLDQLNASLKQITSADSIIESAKYNIEPPKKDSSELEKFVKYEVEKELANKKSWFTISNILAFLSLILSIIAISKLKNTEKKIENLEKKNIDLTNDIDNHSKDFKSQLKEIQKDKTASSSQNIRNERVTPTPVESKQQEINLSVTPSVESQKTSSVKFAKNASNSVFKNIDLKNKQNGEYVFELHIKGKGGDLKLSTDKKVQQYALSSNPDYYFNSDSCIIKGTPATGKEIYLSAPGKIELSSDEMSWKITQKISLEFK